MWFFDSFKDKERIQKFQEKGDSRYIYRNELDKACFQHDIGYGDYKDLARRTASDKVLRDKAFNIAKNPNMMDIKEFLHLWFITFLITTPQLVVVKMKWDKVNNLLKNYINYYKIKKKNIWVVDLADMQSISKCSKTIGFSVCVIDIFNKYVWVFPL